MVMRGNLTNISGGRAAEEEEVNRLTCSQPTYIIQSK